MIPAWFAEIVAGDLQKRRAEGLWRTPTVIAGRRPGRITLAGREYVDLGANDYLGLAGDPRLAEAARRALARWGMGAGASPLVSGYHEELAALETELAAFEQTDAALVFSSGFAANATLIPALVGPGDAVFCEKRNHASLVAGCRLSQAKLVVYRGERLEQLQQRLDRARSFRRRLVVTDTVFSMDGDIAPLADLVTICEKAEALLYVDEAHATGVVGATGGGAAEAAGVRDRIPFRMGTLSKALGGVGGFVATQKDVADWLIQKTGAYLYSTALPPACCAASREAIKIVRQEPWRADQIHRLRRQLIEAANLTGAPLRSQSAIIPILFESVDQANFAGQVLRDQGFWAPVIRPPTVPSGTSRLRISLSASLSVLEIDKLAQTLRALIEGNGGQ